MSGPSPKRARTPRRPLYRLGRPPDPLAWPTVQTIGHERFDDPLRQYRVLYAALQRDACFAETLAGFRPSLSSLAAERAVANADESPRAALVPSAWWRQRLVGCFRLAPARWLDLRALDTFQVLRVAFADLASSLRVSDVDLGAVAGRVPIAGDERRLTQAISRWAFERGFDGIAYTSRLDHRYTCWAVFEGGASRIHPLGPPDLLNPDDPDFARVALRLGLQIEP